MPYSVRKKQPAKPAVKLTKGTVLAAKLRAKTNQQSDKAGGESYLHAMSVIYGATQQTTRARH